MPKELKKYQVTIEDELDPDINMYITAKPIFNDPYEVPYLSIGSDDNFTEYCYRENK